MIIIKQLQKIQLTIAIILMFSTNSSAQVCNYAASVIDFSSEYTNTSWSAQEALGIFNTYPNYGDIVTAWASNSTDSQREFIELAFINPTPIDSIYVYETFNAGAIDTVYVKNPTLNAWEIVYTATATHITNSRILKIGFPRTTYDVSEVRIAINSPAVPSWNEIDAVAINSISADAGEDIILNCSSSTTINLGGSCTTDNAIYSWTTPDGNIISGGNQKIVTVDTFGMYTLTVIKDGITISDTIIVTSNYLSPNINSIADISSLDTLTLPVITGTNLTGNEKYYTAPNGGGTSYLAGTVLNYFDFSSYPITLYIYDINGTLTNNCSDETSFTITINQTATEAPGGITNNNVFWVKANQGVILNGTNISTWIDQSNGGNNATQTNVTYQPLHNNNSRNYNPGIYFDGTDEHMNINDLITAGSSNLNVFAVGSNETGGDSWHVMVHGQSNSGWSGGGYGIAALSGDSTNYGFWVNNWSTNDVNTPWIDQPTAILEGKYNGTNVEFFLDAESKGTDSYSGTIGDAGTTHLGGGNATSYNHKGFINEVAIYNTDLTAIDRQKINSYFGIKYGITIDIVGVTNNYINSLGNSVFNDTGTYWNNIIGIGRDDDSTLLQKQSHQNDDNARIYLNTLNSDNTSNSGTFTNNNQFVMMGNNNNLTLVTTSANSEKPNTINSRIEREWKLTNTNFNNTFNIDIKLDDCIVINNVNDLRLLMDFDGDFSDAIIYDNSNGLTISTVGNYITITGIANTHLAMGSSIYFTIGSVNPDTLSNSLTANAINDIQTCDGNNDGFADFTLDLSAIENQVIGSQTGLTVSYFDALGNAITLTNPYTNIVANSQTIVVRVTNVSNCFEETTFNLIVNPLPNADVLNNTTQCDSYTLPVLTSGNYYTATGGTGTMLNTGDIITTSQTIYIYAANGTCTDETSFEVTINTTPIADIASDISICDNYALPTLTSGNYYTTNGAAGTMLNAGDAITTSQTIYIYAANGTCTDETSFEITINNTPTVDIVNDTTAENSYELPTLTDGNYYTEANAQGTQLYAGDLITVTQTVYVYAETGIEPNICFNQSSFLITVALHVEYMHFFTPNGNGENDYWHLLDTNVTKPNAKINIFNRFGKLMAQINPNSIGWDGNYNGTPLPSSEYWFNVELIDGSILKGNFSLLRK